MTFTSCSIFKGMFDKVEKVPDNFSKKIDVKASELLPDNLADILPDDFFRSIPESEMCEMLKDIIPVNVIEGIIRNYFNTPGKGKTGRISDNIKFKSSIDKHFSELDLPEFEKFIVIRKVIEKSFFEDIDKILKEKSSEIFLNPELEVKGLDLDMSLKVKLTHPQLSGVVSISTEPKVSKNGYGVNDRILLKTNLKIDEEKHIKIDDDSDWVLVSLMNKPGNMYLTVPATLNADIEIKDFNFKTDFDIDVDFEISFTVNDVNNPISSGYVWEISNLNIKKVDLSNTVISGFNVDKNLINAEIKLSGNITAGLK